MSRGPGSFQKDILDRIQRNRGMISWEELKEKLPAQGREPQPSPCCSLPEEDGLPARRHGKRKALVCQLLAPRHA
jgi:hypothetical protein